MLFKKKIKKSKQQEKYYNALRKAYKKEKDVEGVVDNAAKAIFEMRDEFGELMRCEEFLKVSQDGDDARYADEFVFAFEEKLDEATKLYRKIISALYYYEAVLLIEMEKVGKIKCYNRRINEIAQIRSSVVTADTLYENLDEMFDKVLSRMELEDSMTQWIGRLFNKFQRIYEGGNMDVSEAFRAARAEDKAEREKAKKQVSEEQKDAPQDDDETGINPVK